MKLDHMVSTDILADDDIQGQDYGIAEGGMGMAIRAFYQYARPIDAIVREVASNCFDAHKEASLIPNMTDDELKALGYTGDLNELRAHFSKWRNRNIEIELIAPAALGDTERKIVFRDYGVGISPARMSKIMTKFFSSTKRALNDFIGAFGLGSKSPLGYTTAFQMTTWFFGKRYEYLIHEGASTPRLELLGTFDDNRINGTEVIIPIENESDFNSFKKAVTTQLTYFDGLKIKGIEYNPGSIYRGKTFVFRPDNKLTEMHICFGKVYYPLDFDTVGISRYGEGDCPIALYFDIGELPVVWNRESVEYTAEAKAKILDRLQEAKSELQAIWDASFSQIKTAEDFINARSQITVSSLKLPNGTKIPKVNKLITMNAVWPGHKFVAKDPTFAWKVAKYIKNGKTSNNFYVYDVLQIIASGARFYFTNSNVSKPNINSWLNESEGHSEFYLVSREINLDPDSQTISKPSSTIQWQLDMKNGWNSDADKVDFVATLLEIEEFLESKSAGNYDDLEIPEEWREELRKRRKLRVKPTTGMNKKQQYIRSEMPVVLRPIYSDWRTQSRSYYIENTTIGKLEKFKGTIIYGSQEDEKLLMLMYRVFFQMGYSPLTRKKLDSDSKIIVAKVARETMKVLDEIVNAQHIRSFVETPSGFWRRWLTSTLMLENWPKSSRSLFGCTARHKFSPFKDAQETYYRLKLYVRDFRGVEFSDSEKDALGEIRKQLMMIQHWDHEAVSLFWKLKAYTNRWKLLKYIYLEQIPSDELHWIMQQVGLDNPELIMRNNARKLITNNEDIS